MITRFGKPASAVILLIALAVFAMLLAPRVIRLQELKTRSAELEQKWETLLSVREKVLKALEEKREKKEIGNSLEAEVELSSSQTGEKDFLKGFGEDLPGLLLVSRVTVFERPSQSEALEVGVKKAGGRKCERCWNYRDTVGMDKEYGTLCRRCTDVVKAL